MGIRCKKKVSIYFSSKIKIALQPFLPQVHVLVASRSERPARVTKKHIPRKSKKTKVNPMMGNFELT